MRIRKAGSQDARGLVGLFKALRHYELSLLNAEEKKMESEWYKQKTETGISKMIRSSKTALFVAEEQGNLVGFIRVGIWGLSRDAKIFDVYVVPSFRGKGIAKKLTKLALAWLRNKKVRYVSVFVYRKNKSGKKFYEALGLKPITELYKGRV